MASSIKSSKNLQIWDVSRKRHPHTGPVSSFAAKANGKLQTVVDYRRISRRNVVDIYPLPRIDQMLDHAGDALLFFEAGYTFKASIRAHRTNGHLAQSVAR